jgi:hypothetical protein
VPRAERASRLGHRVTIDALLAEGRIDILGLLPRASNFTFLAEVSNGEQTVRAVYKPQQGETPLWDFPDGTLFRREVAAYRLARTLGWPNLPPTVARDGPMGEGSVQLFVDADPGEHYFTLAERCPDEFRAVAAYDVVAGNGDRKGGHCLLAPDGKVWVVDHGLCFSARPYLRTVIWEFAEEPVPSHLIEDLRRVAGELRSGPLRDDLRELLEDEEVDATADRAEELARRGVYPAPGPGRSHPWPAV